MFPSILNTFNRPTPTDRLNSPSHSALHNTVSSALGQVETVIGIEGPNSVVGTLQYLIKSPDSDGGGHVQSTNKGGTGQTTYTKGDVLVAQSTSVLTKLAIGTDGTALVADSAQPLGVKWGSFPAPTVRTYTSSVVTIWNKPSNLAYIVVEVQGGGGGGGGSTDNNVACGGGGGGGYSRKTIAAASLPVAASIRAGSGGARGAASGGTGGTGVLSFFASILTASGGAGGVGSSGAAGPGGAGGQGVGGDVNSIGGSGQAGFNAQAGGMGGVAYFGGGAAITGTDTAGNDAGDFGGGGSGASSAGSDRAGGAGGNGIVIVYEY